MGATANTPRLRRVDCTGPGIHRRRHGRGFRYLGEVIDARLVARAAERNGDATAIQGPVERAVLRLLG